MPQKQRLYRFLLFVGMALLVFALCGLYKYYSSKVEGAAPLLVDPPSMSQVSPRAQEQPNSESVAKTQPPLGVYAAHYVRRKDPRKITTISVGITNQSK